MEKHFIPAPEDSHIDEKIKDRTDLSELYPTPGKGRATRLQIDADIPESPRPYLHYAVITALSPVPILTFIPVAVFFARAFSTSSRIGAYFVLVFVSLAVFFWIAVTALIMKIIARHLEKLNLGSVVVFLAVNALCIIPVSPILYDFCRQIFSESAANAVFGVALFSGSALLAWLTTAVLRYKKLADKAKIALFCALIVASFALAIAYLIKQTF